MAQSTVSAHEEVVILRRAVQRAARIIAAEEQLPSYLWQDAQVIESHHQRAYLQRLHILSLLEHMRNVNSTLGLTTVQKI